MSHDNIKKILVFAELGFDGISTMMVNIQKHIDRERLNFDYLVIHDGTAPFEETVCGMGSEKFSVASDDIAFKPFRRIVRMRRITKLCKKEKIKILHYNTSDTLDFTNMLAAKLGGVKHITVHSHDAGYLWDNKLRRLVFRLCRPLLLLVGNTFWGCSDLAARFMFPKSVIKKNRYMVLHNGIELKRFDFDPALREQIRTELGLDGKFVVGHAGRFTDQKNHSFLIDVFDELYKKDKNAVLVLFGIGETFEACKEKAKKLGLSDVILFMGATDRMAQMYQAMDVFVMPSIHEGLPVVGVEAQATGLHLVLSDEITRETDVTGNTVFLSLSDSAEKWADTILQVKGIPRISGVEKLTKERYDIQQTSDTFADYYIDLLKTL